MNDLRDALDPGKDCPPVEELARYLDAPSAAFTKHLESCAHCRTELALLQSFLSDEVNAADTAAVRQVTERLRARSVEIFPPARGVTARPSPWWKEVFSAGWFRPTVVAFAAVLIVAGVGLEVRRVEAPSLRPLNGEAEVMRSHSINVNAPLGDVEQVPREVRWQAVTGAVKYEVRLLEVDHAELWKSETGDLHIDLPAAVQARIVPAKTLLCEVRASDATGRTVAESNDIRFRLLQKIHQP